MIAKLDAKLNPNADIYRILKTQPDWWIKVTSIHGVYVEIRKDDIVDIYFEGGRIAELKFESGAITAKCHGKYLGIKDAQGEVDCMQTLQTDPYIIIENIKTYYSRKGVSSYEDIKEKKIQGDMISKRNPIFLDSEFEHRFEDGKRSTIRFDLVTIENNKLLFTELKRIKDDRLLTKDPNTNPPEILEQMRQYSNFIKANAKSLLDYYKQLYQIKKELKLPVPKCCLSKLDINNVPHLLIKDTYTEYNPDRLARIKAIKQVVDKSYFTYSLEKDPYEDTQREKQIELFISKPQNRFNCILPENESYKNLYKGDDINERNKVLDYFHTNDIKFWNCKYDSNNNGNDITRHLLSSQVACINHLFFIKHDATAVLSILNGIKNKPNEFKQVLNIPLDQGDNNFIAFEMVSSQDYLHEGKPTRGEYCTSVDAFIYAVDINDERWLIPIEWKYTETYSRDDKSIESDQGTNNERKGKKRLKNYCNISGDNLIGNSKQLKSLDTYKGSIYFQEPFYQLMRQTLWAERICSNPNETLIPAKHFMHIHVCPKANSELLNHHYQEVTNETTMESAWRSMLRNQSLYHLIDPMDLMQPIKKTYPNLYDYLKKRYWD